MEDLYRFIRENTAGLYVQLFVSRFFFVDYWSFVHLFSGALIVAVGHRLGVGSRGRWAALAGILVGYELLELAFIYLAIGVFLPETLPDQGTDLVAGALGGLLAEAAASPEGRARTVRLARNLASGARGDLLASFLIALPWVTFYGYRYNVPALNSPPVSWYALALWAGSVFAMFRFHRLATRKGWTSVRATGVVWAVTLGLILAGEFLGYVVMGIHEVRGGAPLVLGLVHGTLVLKLTYVFAPPAVFGGLTLTKRALGSDGSGRQG